MDLKMFDRVNVFVRYKAWRKLPTLRKQVETIGDAVDELLVQMISVVEQSNDVAQVTTRRLDTFEKAITANAAAMQKFVEETVDTTSNIEATALEAAEAVLDVEEKYEKTRSEVLSTKRAQISRLNELVLDVRRIAEEVVSLSADTAGVRLDFDDSQKPGALKVFEVSDEQVLSIVEKSMATEVVQGLGKRISEVEATAGEFANLYEDMRAMVNQCVKRKQLKKEVTRLSDELAKSFVISDETLAAVTERVLTTIVTADIVGRLRLADVLKDSETLSTPSEKLRKAIIYRSEFSE